MRFERNNMDDDPLNFAMNIILSMNTPVAKLVQNMTGTNVPNIATLISNVQETVRNSEGSRYVVYREINPEIEVHQIYKCKHSINDRFRISFTRLRLSGHNLAIETGR